MKIELRQLSLKNFKGILDMTIEFTSNTILKGNNATGKTTVFDAFTWLLFGKDSSDRKDFNIKNTVKKDLNRADHEVAAHIVVDGNDIEMKRVYREKWQTKRGSAVEEFTGHETIFFVNEVPCSQKEFQAKVEEICNEDLFKLITNPLYFPYMKWQSQREILFGMAGEINDADIAGENEKFIQLLAMISGKTMDEFKREIAAKKKRIKDELGFIPGRIDEVTRSMPAPSDFDVIAIQLGHKQSDLDKIEAQLSDISKASQAQYEARQKLQSEIYQLKSEQQKLMHEAQTRMDASRMQSGAAKRTLQSTIDLLKQRIADATKNMEGWARILNEQNRKREELIAKWDATESKQITFNETDFCCPTCKRAYDVADIDAKQAEMTSNFNTNKANELADINSKGKAVKELIDQTTASIDKCKAEIEAAQNELSEAEARMAGMPTDEVAPAMTEGEKSAIAEIEGRIRDLQNQIDAQLKATDDAQLKATKTTLQTEIDGIKKKLYEKEIIAKSNARIDELKQQQRAMANEVAQLEGLEFTIMEFTKAKVEAIEARVNGLFEIVKFKLFDTQINGQEVETCVATVGGVPYPDLNNAAKINAGLDILKAISSYRNIYAPVFIDNAEAVVDILPIPTQSVRLVVAEQQLEVINH